LAESETYHVPPELERWDRGHLALAWHEIGDIRRRRGGLDGALDAFSQPQALGRDPQPGLVLLRLAQRMQWRQTQHSQRPSPLRMDPTPYLLRSCCRRRCSAPELLSRTLSNAWSPNAWSQYGADFVCCVSI
jgi:hypothetical protein